MGSYRPRALQGQGDPALLAPRKARPSLIEAEGLDLEPPESLYVHVPVCSRKCAYCDFFSVPASSLADSAFDLLVDSTLARAEALAERFGARGIATVYVGGGTPTALPPESLDRLLGGISALAPDALEWTVEANPESLLPRQVEIMACRGVTRISLGAQSLDDGELSLLGRPHRAADALRALGLAASSGMEVSADLIACLPAAGKRRGPAAIAEAARALIGAGAGHLSAYDLTLEEGTPLAARAALLDFPGEDESARERELLEAALAESGFRRYEVSNYAPLGNECLHNLAYWRMDSYIGAGPGAVSTLVAARKTAPRPGIDGASLRIEERRDIDAYLGGEAAARAGEERVAPREAAFESIMMAYRTVFGLDADRFRSRFGVEARSLIGRTLGLWRDSLVEGEPWPIAARGVAGSGRAESGGVARYPALDGRGLDILNRFLGDCLTEMENSFPGGGLSGPGSGGADRS